MNSFTTPCIICNQKNGSSLEEDTLRRLIRLLDDLADEDTPTIHFTWDINERCRYGLYCQSLEQRMLRCRVMTRQIDILFTRLIVSGDQTRYHEALRCLQGHYPRAYRQLEREWHKANKEELLPCT